MGPPTLNRNSKVAGHETSEQRAAKMLNTASKCSYKNEGSFKKQQNFHIYEVKRQHLR